MVKAKRIIKFLEDEFPEDLEYGWDLTDGLIQGDVEKDIIDVLLTLEVREGIMNCDGDMVILHHPLYLEKKRILLTRFMKRMIKLFIRFILELIEQGLWLRVWLSNYLRMNLI